MKRLAGLTTLALLVSTTGGCGWLWGEQGYFRDRGNDYLNARQHPPMQVPAGTEVRPLEPLLPIPHQVADKRASADYEVPRPPKLPAGQARSAEPGESVSLLAERDFDAPREVQAIQGATGNPLLELGSDFDRAWASVGRALQDADIRVEDLNRSLGIYYINLAEGAEEDEGRPGFFSRLFSFGDDDEAREARAERYQVRLTPLEGRVQVSVERDLDTLAPAETARSILNRIQDNLD